MGTGKIRVIADKSRRSSDKQVLIDASSKSGQRVAIGSGLHGNAGMHRLQPTFGSKPDRRIIQNPDSAAAIILDNNQEYSEDGADFCSRILIVAGVDGTKLSENNVIDEYDPVKSAAYIVVNQQGRPQKALNLALPTLEDGGGSDRAN